MRIAIFILFCILFIDAVAANAQQKKFERADKAVEALNVLCLSGKQYALKLNAQGNLVFLRLVPGAEAKVEIDSREAVGATGYFDERVRLLADKQIIQCMQPHIPRILDEILNPSSGALEENVLELDARSDDPAKRARAFKQAFAALKVFRVKLTLAEPPPPYVNANLSTYENMITSPIGYYDIETGEFRQKEQPLVIHLVGQISGDTLIFKKKRCSGTLHNVKNTWEFKGLISCDALRLNGVMRLR